MQPVETGKVRCTINVTPLVDVVLVLLIIFMVVAPVLHQAGDVRLPKTDRPPDDPGDGRRILVSVERDGEIMVDGKSVDGNTFFELMSATAAEDANAQVLLQGDSRLAFGEVKQAMLAVEAAGFQGVRLIAERQAPLEPEEE